MAGLTAVQYQRLFLFAAANDGALRACQTALAAKRFQLQHNRWPRTREELVPEFLPAWPDDPFDGQPLRLIASENEFAVYSLGENETDDGGDLHYEPYISRPKDIGVRMRR